MTQAPKVKKKKKKRKTGKCQDCFCLAKQFVILLFFLTEATRTIFFYWQSNERKPKEKKKEKKNPKKHLKTILHQQNTDILLVLQRLPTKFQFQVGYIISKNQSCKMSNSLKTVKWLLET